MENKKLNDFASGLILSTNTISCNTDMPQSRDISQRATKPLLLHLKKSKPAKLITGLMTSEQHKNSWIFISFWTTLSFSKEMGRKRKLLNHYIHIKCTPIRMQYMEDQFFTTNS